ncbi:MAG: TonB-dependent receptor plug domain-containing protein [Bacteroidales bacterium]|nr:TonB-dependent receptor plug domain-containing protein [Bacteroidales bacterium]
MNKIFLCIISVLMLSVFSENLSAQNWIAKGYTVLGDNIPVGNVPMHSGKTKASTKSDSTGYFEIEVASKDRIVISGCAPFLEKNYKVIKQDSLLKIQLVLPEDLGKAELALGYGYINEQYRTDVVRTVKAKKDFSRYSDIWMLIKEKFNNVNILQGGCVVVRGQGSNSQNVCAMFVVDGVPVTKVDYLATSNIKEISLLKDASAAIYGVEGANGVFLINTWK